MELCTPGWLSCPSRFEFPGSGQALFAAQSAQGCCAAICLCIIDHCSLLIICSRLLDYAHQHVAGVALCQGTCTHACVVRFRETGTATLVFGLVFVYLFKEHDPKW